jgi:hypothetical protein
LEQDAAASLVDAVLPDVDAAITNSVSGLSGSIASCAANSVIATFAADAASGKPVSTIVNDLGASITGSMIGAAEGSVLAGLENILGNGAFPTVASLDANFAFTPAGLSGAVEMVVSTAAMDSLTTQDIAALASVAGGAERITEITSQTGETLTLTIAQALALEQSGILLVSSSIDIGGAGVAATIGFGDALSVNGSGATLTASGGGDTVSIAGAGDLVTIGGNGQNATSALNDIVQFASGGTLQELVGSTVSAYGSGIAAVVGATGALSDDNLTISGAGNLVNANGWGDLVTIGGNGQNATSALDDIIQFASGGTLQELANSTVSAYGSGIAAVVGAAGALNDDNLTISGAGNLVNANGWGDTISIDGDNGSAVAGLSATTLQFLGATNQLMLNGSGIGIDMTMHSQIGIEVISNFQYGLDDLFIDLAGAPNSLLEASNTFLNGVKAISLYSSADPGNGIVLAGVASTMSAQDLLANHLTFANGMASIK